MVSKALRWDDLPAGLQQAKVWRHLLQFRGGHDRKRCTAEEVSVEGGAPLSCGYSADRAQLSWKSSAKPKRENQ